MCLGVPGKVLSIEASTIGMPMGVVSFGGITKEVCLAYTPDVKIGEYVLVHVGFAISKLDEQQALEVFQVLKDMGDLGDLEIPQPSGGGKT
ncbi:MAG: HypC/HybG/HupF family hydrogenase formation chaperone [Thermoanaerobaculia bacterium]|jgi:hydrogenase expression/formation protein HypC